MVQLRKREFSNDVFRFSSFKDTIWIGHGIPQWGRKEFPRSTPGSICFELLSEFAPFIDVIQSRDNLNFQTAFFTFSSFKGSILDWSWNSAVGRK